MKSTITVILTILLSACAASAPLPVYSSETAPQQNRPLSKEEPADEAAKPAAESSPEPDKEDKSLPSVTLTSDLLYEILTADFAYQSGQWQPAYASMMEIAEKTRDPRAARHAAEMAIKAHHIDKSLAATRLWLRLAPDSEEAERFYIAFLVLGDDLMEAQPIFARRLSEAPPSARGILILQIQRLLAAAKNKSLAFAVLDDVLAPYSSMLEAHVALSLMSFSNGDQARAIDEANKALAIKPSSELAALTLAQAITDPVESSRLLDSFLATYPRAREVRIAYARMLIGQKQYDKARAEFEKLLESRPHDPVSLYSLGILSLQGSDTKSAERYFTDYLESMTLQQREVRELHQVLFLLAQIAEEQGDHETALKWLEKVESGSEDAGAYLRARFKSAQIIARKGDVSGARKLLAALPAESLSEQEQIILAEAQILRDVGQPQESFAVLEAGVEQFPDNVNLLYDYALAAEKLDRLEVMESALRRIFTLDPANFQAYNALGYSLADRNIRLSEAFTLIDKALRFAPNDPFILDSMGWVLYRQGKLPEAEEKLRQAYQLRPDVEIAVHLGEVLWASDQRDEAQKLWAEAGKKEPNNALLKDTLKRLNIRP